MSDFEFEKCLQSYATEERLWNSDDSNASDKAAAWRQQMILLHHLTRSSSRSNQCAILAHHHSKLNSKSNEDYLQQRVDSVKALLQGYHKPNTPSSIIDVTDTLPELDEELFEDSCRGAYESCSKDEISSNDLEVFKSGGFVQEHTICLPAATAATAATSVDGLRNSIGNFLQARNKQSPTPTSSQHDNNKRRIDNEEVSSASSANGFRTAREELMLQNLKKTGISNVTSNNSASTSSSAPIFNYGATKKSLGIRRSVKSGFVPPIRQEDLLLGGVSTGVRPSPPNAVSSTPPSNSPPEPVDERLVNIEPRMIALITSEIMHKQKPVSWNDITGLDYAKSIIKEAVVYPLLRPDIFTGLRRPPRGILLFGPPGTGKTLIGKCIASQSQSTFFSISASSLTSKWVGDGEKMVRALFAVATVHQPSVVFIDEIDSLLCQRSETEHESSRRLKTEFLIQLDGAATSEDDRILIVGATNRPQELDDAARRRLVRRLYIPLPETEARTQILTNLLQTVRNTLTKDEIKEIGVSTDGYSCADMESLCREASMEPIRSIPAEDILHFKEDTVRAVIVQDFYNALKNVRPSVSQDDLKQYVEWNTIYGAFR